MHITLFAIAFPVLLAIDAVWLGILAKEFYKAQIGPLMRPDVNWIAALLLYAILTLGLVVFVIAPAVEKRQWLAALSMGAFFGFVTYATYDLTNLAVTKHWPLTVTIVDIAWGTVLASAVSVVTYFIAVKIV